MFLFMNKKEGLEKKVKMGEFSIKIGCTDRKYPRVIYFEGSTYISPEYDNDEYVTIMNSLERFARRSVLKTISSENSPFVANNFIVNFSSSSERMKKGKYSNLQFEYYLVQPQENILSVSEFLKKYKEEFLQPFIELENELIDKNFTICNKKLKPTK
jgi:hypothetical protein